MVWLTSCLQNELLPLDFKRCKEWMVHISLTKSMKLLPIDECFKSMFKQHEAQNMFRKQYFYKVCLFFNLVYKISKITINQNIYIYDFLLRSILHRRKSQFIATPLWTIESLHWHSLQTTWPVLTFFFQGFLKFVQINTKTGLLLDLLNTFKIINTTLEINI